MKYFIKPQQVNPGTQEQHYAGGSSDGEHHQINYVGGSSDGENHQIMHHASDSTAATSTDDNLEASDMSDNAHPHKHHHEVTDAESSESEISLPEQEIMHNVAQTLAGLRDGSDSDRSPEPAEHFKMPTNFIDIITPNHSSAGEESVGVKTVSPKNVSPTMLLSEAPKRSLADQALMNIYTCSLRACGQKFQQAAHLAVHMRRHTGERPYKCETCQVSFSQRGNLKTHERIHTQEKPYVCGQCGRGFCQLGNLRTHEHTHSGERKFVCRLQDCNKLGNMKSHQVKYHGVVPGTSKDGVEYQICPGNKLPRVGVDGADVVIAPAVVPIVAAASSSVVPKRKKQKVAADKV